MKKITLEKLHWLGHASFRIDGEKTIYLDPYQLAKGAAKADIVLITHEHFDHCSCEDLKIISSRDTVIVADKTVSKKLKDAKVPCKEIMELSPDNGTELSGIKIKAVPSYNIGKPYHTKMSEKLGFIVTVDDVSFYHAGDTDLIPEMKEYSCDVALLPIGGTYTMTASEAAEAALLIKPKIAIPIHYGSVVGKDADAEEFKLLLRGKIDVEILKKEN